MKSCCQRFSSNGRDIEGLDLASEKAFEEWNAPTDHILITMRLMPELPYYHSDPEIKCEEEGLKIIICKG